MDNSLAIIVYLMLYRLSIIAVGALSITLGYKLFVKGIFDGQGGNGAELAASVGDSTVTLKNAAPGTFFALFGVVVISAMIINSPPEAKSSQVVQSREEGAPAGTTEWSLRGDGDDFLKVAARLNDLAWDQHDSGAGQEAVIYSRLSIQFAPENANFMDTLASMLFETGRFAEALKFKETAARLDPEKSGDLDKYRAAVQ